jgi:predicted RNase H-like nuclease
MGAAPRWSVVGMGQLGAIQPAAGLALVLIDMPIGLPERVLPVRGCEPEARRLLGPRRSSVFSPPCRAALAETSYPEASAANRRETGRGLSRQSWGIAAKIAALDEALRKGALDPARATVWEAHPELCLWAMNGGRPMHHWKRTPAGQRERIRLLNRVEPGLGRWIAAQSPRLRGHGAAPNDLVDALALAVAARRGYPRGFRAIPYPPQHDARGLPMQMVYWQPAG